MKRRVLVLAVLGCMLGTSAMAASHNETDRSIAGYAMTAAVSSALEGEHNPDWMKRTTVNMSFQKEWKPQYEVETVNACREAYEGCCVCTRSCKQCI